MRVSKAVLSALLAGGVVLAGAGAAQAVSAGGYSPSQQDCPPNADASDVPAAQPGCHDFKFNLEDGNGNRYAEFGLDQMKLGPGAIIFFAKPGDPNFPHSGCVAADTNGTGGGSGVGCGTGSGFGALAQFDTENPTNSNVSPHTGTVNVDPLVAAIRSGFGIYLGADDNLAGGEHDGVTSGNGTAGSVNGPSDGGAVQAYVSPGAATTTPSATNPTPLVGASEGTCQDGVCQETTTHRQTIYQGGGDGGAQRDVANYQGKQWDPSNCSSGDTAGEKACNGTGPNGYTHQTMDQWRQAEASNVYAEPGVQVYEDPDPQGSPIGPYPLPGAYVGTCGVVAGGGTAPAAPASPVTNGAGQINASTGVC